MTIMTRKKLQALHIAAPVSGYRMICRQWHEEGMERERVRKERKEREDE